MRVLEMIRRSLTVMLLALLVVTASVAVVGCGADGSSTHDDSDDDSDNDNDNDNDSVGDNVAVTSVVMSVGDAMALVPGETHELTVLVSPATATDRGLAWSSSDKRVATVAVDGDTATITAVGDGEATITAVNMASGVADTVVVTVATVVIPVDRVAFSQEKFLGGTGSTYDLSSYLVLTSDTEGVPPTPVAVVWTSSDTSVARFEHSGKGEIETLTNGSITVTATVTLEDGSTVSGEARFRSGYVVAPIARGSYGCTDTVYDNLFLLVEVPSEFSEFLSSMLVEGLSSFGWEVEDAVKPGLFCSNRYAVMRGFTVYLGFDVIEVYVDQTAM